MNAMMYGNSAGDPKYRVPPLDPLLIEELSVKQGSSNFGLSFTARNVSIRGLKNVQVKAVRSGSSSQQQDSDRNLIKQAVRSGSSSQQQDSDRNLIKQAEIGRAHV
jgi:hypothetical protein